MNYTDKRRGFSIDIPPGWKVVPTVNSINIIRDTKTFIILMPIAGKPGDNPVLILRTLYNNAKKSNPDVKILNIRTTPGGDMAQLLLNYSQDGSAIKALYIAGLSRNHVMLCGYESPICEFDDKHLILKNILNSLNINLKTFYGNQNVSDNTGYKFQQFTIKSTPLGVYGIMPVDWEFGGGVDVGAVAHDPSGKIGASLNNVPPMAGLNHQSPWNSLLNGFISVAKLRNVQVLNRSRCYDYENLLRATGVNAISETIELNALSPTNILNKVASTATVLNFGVTSIIEFRTIWAPVEMFDVLKPVLIEIVLSLSVDSGAVQRKMAAQGAALKKLSDTISSTTNIVIEACDSHMRDVNRRMEKWSYFSAGEQAFYSSLENKVYVGKSDWGDYISNPNYPQEIMTTIVPDNLWDKIEHDRRFGHGSI